MPPSVTQSPQGVLSIPEPDACPPHSADGWISKELFPATVLGIIIAATAVVSIVGVCCHRQSKRRREQKLAERREEYADAVQVGAEVVRDIKSAFPNPPREYHYCRQSQASVPASRRPSGSTVTAGEPKNAAWTTRKPTSATAATSLQGSNPLSTTLSQADRPHSRSPSGALVSPAAQQFQGSLLPLSELAHAPDRRPRDVYAMDTDPVVASLALPADAISTSDGPAPSGGYYDEPGGACASHPVNMFSVDDERAAVERVSRACASLRAGDAGKGSTAAFPFAGYIYRPASTVSGIVWFGERHPKIERMRQGVEGGIRDNKESRRDNACSGVQLESPTARAERSGAHWEVETVPYSSEHNSTVESVTEDARAVTPMDILISPRRCSVRSNPVVESARLESNRTTGRRPSLPSEILRRCSHPLRQNLQSHRRTLPTVTAEQMKGWQRQQYQCAR